MSAAAMTCPHCGSSMQGDPIPERYQQHADDHDEQVARNGRCFCLPYGDSTHFSRVMGHEVSGIYDGVLFWVCPDCHHAWPRWNDGLGRLSVEATRHAAMWNDAVRAVS